MKVVYAESSAVLAWLLREDGEQAVLKELRGADRIVSSTLTSVECARVLARGRAIKRLTESEELAGRQLLDQAASTWYVMDVSERVVHRARGSFPHEPVRTLDALHLATAMVFNEAVGSIRVLSLDERVRRNAIALGLTVVPADSQPGR